MLRRGSLSKAVFSLVALSMGGASCSFPFFGHSIEVSQGTSIPARLSGVVELGEGCRAGYYQIHLTGLFESAQTQVDAQTDLNGRFSVVAPPGHYLVHFAKGPCGTQQVMDLEENTEHMVSVVVAETKAIESSVDSTARLPASVLIKPSR